MVLHPPYPLVPQGVISSTKPGVKIAKCGPETKQKLLAGSERYALLVGIEFGFSTAGSMSIVRYILGGFQHHTNGLEWIL